MRMILALIFISLNAFAADNIIGSGSAHTLIDANGTQWNTQMSFTTDGNGDIFTLGDVASNDNIIGTPSSNSRTLIDSLGRRWDAFVTYTTDGNGNVIPVPAGGGGGGSGNINSGGNAFGFNLKLGTTDNFNLSLIADNVVAETITPNGTLYPYASFGVSAQFGTGMTNQYEFYDSSNGSGDQKNYTGLYAETDLTDTTDGSGFQQGIYGLVHSEHNSGTYALLRNYFMAEHLGDGTITETYGARALTRIYDKNYPTVVSHGTVVNGYGLEAYAHSTSPTGLMKNATGIYITHAAAGNSAGTITDSDPHVAYGLRISSDITATGSSTQNIAKAIQSDATASSALNGELDLDTHAPIRFSDTNFKYALLNAPTTITSSYNLTLPTGLGNTGDCINTTSAGVLSFGACVTNAGSGTSLVYAAGQLKSLSAGTGISLTDNGSGSLTVAATGGGGGGNVSFGGNTQGADSTVGLQDGFKFSLVTSNTPRLNITSGGISTFHGNVGDFGVAPGIFGVYDFHTANDNFPESDFETYFAFFGNSSNSKDGAAFSYSLRPGDPTFTYSGEYNGFTSKAFLGTSGTVAQISAQKNQTSVTNSSGILNFGFGWESSVLASAGIIKNATGGSITDAQATGTDTASHTAIGLDVGSGGIVASGSSVSNTSIGIHIGTVTGGSGTTYAIKSDTTAVSRFAGDVSMRHHIGNTSAPTVAAGAAAGTSPTVSASGNDTGFTLNVTTGATPGSSGILATVTFNVAYASAPRVSCFANNSATALAATAVSGTKTTTTFVMNVGTVPLTTATAYSWDCVAIQ